LPKWSLWYNVYGFIKTKIVMKTDSRAKSRPRAIQNSRHLHVVPRAHTGHVLPRHHTSYPTLAMIVLCAGVLLASWTRWVNADPPTYGPASGSYDVHVRVPGPPPSVPATIETTNNSPVVARLTVKSLPLSITGSCPVNTYEVLYRNSVFSGVALCDAAGSYGLQTDLFPGLNRLQVQDYSLTDAAGPLSDTIEVVYEPPMPPPTGGTTASSPTHPSGQTIPPLVVKTNFIFQGYYRGESTPWTLDVEGGTPPYAVEVVWGDGEHSLISRPNAGSFDLSHIYKSAGAYKGSYGVVVTASDSAGQQTYLQLLSIINNPPNAAGSTGGKAKPPSISFLATTPDSLKRLTAYLWPGYGMVVLMLISFWLGERRELHVLRPYLKGAHRRRA
jgi:hypothetical protein